MLSQKQGEILVKFARHTIESYFEGKELKEPGEFSQKQGVFVTLLKFPEQELRGCIGFPYPALALNRAVKEAAKSAAFNDFRFLQLQKDELKEIIIEISVLTPPKEMKCKKEALPENIELGKDGLIVLCQGKSGLLLPQVAKEWKWSSGEFLEQVCIKAGLNKEAWKQKNCKIYKFQAQIFSEENPDGTIFERKIT